MGKQQNNFSTAKLVLLIVISLSCGGIFLIFQQVFDILDNGFLNWYQRPSKLSYLWYSDRDPQDDCRNCDNMSIKVLYPMEHDGIIAVGGQLSWEIQTAQLIESNESATFKQLHELVRQENPNISASSLQPCIKSSVYLDHAMQYWQSNRYNVVFMAPQVDRIMSLHVRPEQVFNLLDHPASYTLEISVKVGMCVFDNTIAATDLGQSVDFIEPKNPHNRHEVRYRRPFYSLQYRKSEETQALFGEGNILVLSPPSVTTAQSSTNSSESDAPTSSSSPTPSLENNAHYTTTVDVIAATATKIIAEAPVTTPPLNNLPSAEEPVVEMTPASITKMLLANRVARDNLRHSSSHDTLSSGGLHMEIEIPKTISLPHVQLANWEMPKLYRTRKLFIDYPEPMSHLVQNGSWNLALSFPLAFLLVPSIRMYAAVDGAIYDISLSHELATLLENDSAKAKQLTDRWAEATKEFISGASQYEVESFLAARQAVLTGPVTATLSVEDFFPSFLETQVYQQSLFGDFRQLNIITFPELGEGWHQIDIYVAVSRHHLLQKLQQVFSMAGGEKVPPTMSQEKSVNDVIVSFDSLRFCVDRSAIV